MSCCDSFYFAEEKTLWETVTQYTNRNPVLKYLINMHFNFEQVHFYIDFTAKY